MTPSQKHRMEDGLPYLGAQPASIRLRTTKFDPLADIAHRVAYDKREFFDPAGVPVTHAASALFNHFMSKHAGEKDIWGQVLYFPAIDASGTALDNFEHLIFSGTQVPKEFSVSMQAFNPLTHVKVVGDTLVMPIDYSGITASVSKRFRGAHPPKP